MLSDGQQDTIGVHSIEQEYCGLCEDLLANLQRFFCILENARKLSDSEWMTVEEVASELKISKSVVYRLIRNGQIEAVDLVVGEDGGLPQKGHYRIRRSALYRYLEAKKVKTLPEASRRQPSRRFPKAKNHLRL
jgi:excisionase family DNA binding protein